MSDFDFDSRLERLFNQPPRVSDPEGFARRVEDRLDREWTLRRGLIGVAGVVGGLITLSQTVGSGVMTRLQSVAGPASEAISQQSAQLSLERLLGDQMIWTGEALWTIAVLGGLAAAFVATRWADNL